MDSQAMNSAMAETPELDGDLVKELEKKLNSSLTDLNMKMIKVQSQLKIINLMLTASKGGNNENSMKRKKEGQKDNHN